ncbi:hypothetical protein J1605_011793 [Eschrichtius robustus]|uniref:Uncharacterized protein n=1 Tax=Eschrichtius robustus TaxID=9764 RepID=A0AB34GNE4_ESCRO|nr:hypothetical protein J1605_011793 [Eschrichtius robustus]
MCLLFGRSGAEEPPKRSPCNAGLRAGREFRCVLLKSSPCLGPTSPPGQSRRWPRAPSPGWLQGRPQPGPSRPAVGEDAQGEAPASSTRRAAGLARIPASRKPWPGAHHLALGAGRGPARARWRSLGVGGSRDPLCLSKAGGGLDLAWNPDWQVPGFRRGSQHSWGSRPASLLLAEPCPSCLRVFARNCRATPSRCGVSTGRVCSDFSKSALRHLASAGPRTPALGPGDRCAPAPAAPGPRGRAPDAPPRTQTNGSTDSRSGGAGGAGAAAAAAAAGRRARAEDTG